MAKPAARTTPAAPRPAPPMRARRPSIARRVLLALLAGNALVVGGLVVIGWLALSDLFWSAPPAAERFGYALLDRLLQPGTLGAIVGLLLFVPLVVWIVARRTLRPSITSPRAFRRSGAASSAPACPWPRARCCCSTASSFWWKASAAKRRAGAGSAAARSIGGTTRVAAFFIARW